MPITAFLLNALKYNFCGKVFLKQPILTSNAFLHFKKKRFRAPLNLLGHNLAKCRRTTQRNQNTSKKVIGMTLPLAMFSKTALPSTFAHNMPMYRWRNESTWHTSRHKYTSWQYDEYLVSAVTGKQKKKSIEPFLHRQHTCLETSWKVRTVVAELGKAHISLLLTANVVQFSMTATTMPCLRTSS